MSPGVNVPLMKPERFEVIDISTEPGVATAVCCGRKMLLANHFRRPEHRFFGIRMAVLMDEHPCCMLIVRRLYTA
jgi:hypothetical protein